MPVRKSVVSTRSSSKSSKTPKTKVKALKKAVKKKKSKKPRNRIQLPSGIIDQLKAANKFTTIFLSSWK